MASDVDICNLALGYLGDEASVSSIDPPEGSAQADHCARFYPIARDALLEMHAWGFATRRAQLALLGSSWPEWQYAYAVPADALNLLAVLAPDATDDYSAEFALPGCAPAAVNRGVGIYTPQPFEAEALDSGAQVIYTNQENAVLRYTALVSDTTQFSPLFVEALAWLLASKLAGPILKGDAGAAAARNCYQMFRAAYAQATVSDANQRRVNVTPQTAWMANR